MTMSKSGGMRLKKVGVCCFFNFTQLSHNFNKYEDDFITDLNTPYDYESIMHYRPLSFNKNESIPTITTTIPYFNDVIDSGYFMRFDTSSGAAGNSGLLESRILYPKRGEGDDAWKIAHVTLKTSKKFRYIFQGIRGSASSSGAILIDDITLTETVCPSLVWQIHNFTGLLTTTPLGTPVKSKCAYNSEGYSFGVSVYPTGRHSDYPDYVGIALHLCSGENDGVMQWPAKNRQATIVALDQDPDVTLRMSSTRSFTTGRQ
ncbi:hypothetical protein GOODEAATRI_004969 [Goodea atripinnis]|uniref:Metalloendopeptidase n=1 Tax=Goodea atripinnis TaxID=208336 RepID=A0ABV0P1Q6_9TELE